MVPEIKEEASLVETKEAQPALVEVNEAPIEESEESSEVKEEPAVLAEATAPEESSPAANAEDVKEEAEAEAQPTAAAQETDLADLQTEVLSTDSGIHFAQTSEPSAPVLPAV